MVTDCSEMFWLWITLVCMFLLWMVFAVKACFAWKKVSTDLGHCWNQVVDEDAYIAEQLHRIDMLDGKCDELRERLAETSSEVSMVHD